MVEQRQGFSVPSAVLSNTVPQVLPKREYASSFSSDPEFDLLLACCACDENVERVQNALWGELEWERLARQQQIKLWIDRKSTRLNSSHLGISYAVFCLKKKKQERTP